MTETAGVPQWSSTCVCAGDQLTCCLQFHLSLPSMLNLHHHHHHHGIYSAHITDKWTSGQPAKLPLPCGGSRPHVTHGSLVPHESATKRRLDWFIRFLHSTSVWSKHTHRHADHATWEIRSNRPHLCTACIRCGLNIKNKNTKNAKGIRNKYVLSLCECDCVSAHLQSRVTGNSGVNGHANYMYVGTILLALPDGPWVPGRQLRGLLLQMSHVARQSVWLWAN